MGRNSDASSDSDDNDEDSNDDDRVELVDQFVSSGLHVERIISVSNGFKIDLCRCCNSCDMMEE